MGFRRGLVLLLYGVAAVRHTEATMLCCNIGVADIIVAKVSLMDHRYKLRGNLRSLRDCAMMVLVRPRALFLEFAPILGTSGGGAEVIAASFFGTLGLRSGVCSDL